MQIFRSTILKAWILSVAIFIFFGIMLCLAVADAIEVTDAGRQNRRYHIIGTYRESQRQHD